MTERELILETDVLATQYFTNYAHNDGKRIREVFEEYFTLVTEDTKVSKRVISNATIIIGIYWRNINDIDSNVLENIRDTIEYLEYMLDSWSLNIAYEILIGECAQPFDDKDVRNMLQERYPEA